MNLITTITRVRKDRWMSCLFLLLAIWASPAAKAQFSIVGSTCGVPGAISIYNISGGFSTADKWCVTNGVISGSTQSCVMNTGSPTLAVIWNAFATSGTISYYHPATATTPVATLTVSIQDGGTVSPGAVFVPSGVPFTINLTGTPPTLNCSTINGYSWLMGPNSSSLSPVANANPNPQNFTFTGTFTTSMMIERVVSIQGQNVPSAPPVSIIPQPAFTPAVISAPSTCIASGTSPGTLTTAGASGGSCSSPGNFLYQWQSSPDGQNWTGISVTGDPRAFSYTPPALTTTTFYRLLCNCGPLSMNSNVLTVTVYPSLAAGTISTGPKSINYATSPGLISCSAPTGGGCSPSYSYQWQQSPDNVNWISAPPAGSDPGTNQNYTPGPETANTWFRLEASVNGHSVFSNSVLMTVFPQVGAGSVSPSSQAINYNTVPGALTVSGVSGGNGSYGYQWYSDASGSMQPISGATSATYAPGQLTATTHYQVVVNSNGATATTAPVTVNVFPQLVSGTISPASQTLNYGVASATLTVSSPSGGNGVYSYQWQYSSAPGGAYTPIGSGGNSFAPGILNTTTYYEVVTASNGVSVTSAPAAVSVNLNGGAIGVAGAATYGATMGITSVADAEGGSCGSGYTYQWLQSTDGVNYQAIGGAAGNTYTTGNLTYPVWLVRQVTCGSSTAMSNALNVKVAAALSGGTITPGSESVTTGGNAGLLTASEASGGNCGGSYSYQWQSSPDGVNFTSVGVGTQSYNPGTVGGTTWYRRQVTCGNETQNTNVGMVTAISGTDTPTLNYIRERDISRPGVANFPLADALTSPLDMRQTMQYFDGIDRAMQTVVYQASPLRHDLVKPIVYDAYGREAASYLPYTAPSNDGLYKANSLTEQSAFNSGQYPDDQYFYGQTDFEASPINRPSITYSAGNSWIGAGRGEAIQYLLNTVQDSVQIWDIGFAAGNLPFTTGIYGDGQLYKNLTVDEQGHQVIAYMSKEGHIVLRKVQSADNPGSAHVGWLCNYYVYDDLDNLRFVITPRAVELINSGPAWSLSQSTADELCYRYEYDSRNRPGVKKGPGAGPASMVYDVLDRLVLAQDANLQAANQWMATEYDGLNRPTETGLIAYAASQPVMQQLVTGQTPGNPVPPGATLQPQTIIYYDDYAWVGGTGTGLSSSFISAVAGNANYFVTSYNASPTYALPMVAYPVARGKVTGTQNLVLGTAGQYLYTVNYYDERSRLIQTQTLNYTGGLDTLTTQFDFSGKVIRSLLGQAKPTNTAQYHRVGTKSNYDAGFRITSIWKNIDGATTDQVIDSLQYDESGRLKAKYLGGSPAAGGPLDSLVYDYNIRGLVTGINKSYVAGTANHYFGMELGYDNAVSAAGTNYSNPLFNGNIAGTVWKSAGDGVSRKYDFAYDNVNRLTGATYLDNHSGSWDHSAMDYTVSGLTYDANGNILSMNQKGFKIGNPQATIDQLTYSYAAGSNKLLQINDAVNDAASTLGDFHYKGSKQAVDYSYDGNGNLVLDNNKGIDRIVYNYLNLPQQVHMMGEGNIIYTYDAGGNKLQKQTIDSVAGQITTTLYLDGFQYQRRSPIASPSSGTDTLQFVAHEEGRARWAFHKYLNGDSAYGWEYDFTERDHLGNTRVLLTQEKDTSQYIATMEAGYRRTEDALFYGLDSTSYARSSIPGYPNDLNVTNPNDSVARVNGSGPKVGPAIILKVVAGDKIDLGVQYYYNSMSNSNGPSLTAQNLLNSLASGLAGLSAPARESFSVLTNSGNSPLLAALTSSIDSQNAIGTGKPQAYLNWVLLDNQFNYVAGNNQSGALQVGSAGTQSNGQLQPQLAYTGLPITKSGYLYIYVSNATPGWDVFFDNLSVKHYRGAMLEENHYYPFGLTMAGISDKAVKTHYTENKYRFNGGSELQSKEFLDGSELQVYETPMRNYDPQLGVFHQQDPLADVYNFTSPYQYALDNPLSYNDPSGAIDEDQLNAIVNQLLNSANGGNWYNTTSGGYTHEYQSQEEAFTNGVSEAYLSGYLGSGAEAKDNFNKILGKYNEMTGADVHLNTPVLALGNRNKKGVWEIANENGLQHQLFANGAYYGPWVNNYINPFLEETSDARNYAGLIVPMLDGAGLVVEEAKEAHNFMSLRGALNPSAEIKSMRTISKIGKFAEVAGKVLGVVSVVDHSVKAYDDFKSGHVWGGIWNCLKVAADVTFMVVKSNPIVMAASVVYAVVDVATSDD